MTLLRKKPKKSAAKKSCEVEENKQKIDIEKQLFIYFNDVMSS